MRWNTASRNVRGVRSEYSLGTLEGELGGEKRENVSPNTMSRFSRPQGDIYRGAKRGEGKCQKSLPLTSGYVGKKQARSMTG
jgi:hypothetical protein